MPVAAVSALLVAAVPVALFLLIWVVVTAMRLLFPERPLPFDPAARREAARRRGEAVAVRARDIADDLRREAPRPAFPSSQPVPSEDGAHTALAADLWQRRN